MHIRNCGISDAIHSDRYVRVQPRSSTNSLCYIRLVHRLASHFRCRRTKPLGRLAGLLLSTLVAGICTDPGNQAPLEKKIHWKRDAIKVLPFGNRLDLPQLYHMIRMIGR